MSDEDLPSLRRVIEGAAVGFGAALATGLVGAPSQQEYPQERVACESCHTAFDQPDVQGARYQFCPYCGEGQVWGGSETDEQTPATEVADG